MSDNADEPSNAGREEATGPFRDNGGVVAEIAGEPGGNSGGVTTADVLASMIMIGLHTIVLVSKNGKIIRICIISVFCMQMDLRA